MKKICKTIGIVLGHLVCISIIIFCIVKNDKLFDKETNSMQTVLKPTIVTPYMPELTPTETPEPTPTETPEPTPTNTPELTPTETPEPMPTETPEPTPTETPEPTPTETPEPTLTETPEPTPTETPEPTPTNTPEPEYVLSDREAQKLKVLQKISEGTYSSLDNKKYSWWFLRKKEHVPSGSGEAYDITEYEGYYLNNFVEENDKVIYMTIDCGYGSTNTPVMLDIFKKHDIKVMFFVTKFFIEANPQYVKRMVEEGHLVGNHSVSHADLTSLTDQEVYDEIIGCEQAFYEVTGKQMDMYFRPPEGAYSRRTLQITEDLGYKTIFWSIAYGDYDKNNQPEVSWVVNHFDTYHHNGAIPLMHNDSNANRDAMDQVLTLLENEGYRFGTLNELK